MSEAQDKYKQERIMKLKKYENHIRQRIAGEMPAKHKDHEEEFRFWLNSELKRTLRSIESLGGSL